MPTLGLAAGPIERVRADVAVVPLFDGERPLREAAGRVDWRLCGHLSQLVATGRLVGASGEAVLIPGGGGLRVARVLGLGLGEREALDTTRWEAWVADALQRALGLGAGHAVVALPESAHQLPDRLAALAEGALEAGGPAEISLVAEPDDGAGASEWLGQAARRLRRAGLEIRPPGRPPLGAERSATALRSSPTPAGRSTR